MSRHFIFTRYLYEKEEVGYSLLLALLQKKEDEAIFWARELYDSGFEEEVCEFLWVIFQNFYASLNIKFEPYLLNKIALLLVNECGGNDDDNEIKNQTEKDKKIIHLHLIIKNLIIRPYNLDTFSLFALITDFEFESQIKELNQESHDYLQIGKLILDEWREKEEDFLEEKLESFIQGSNKDNNSLEIHENVKNVKNIKKTMEWLKSSKLSLSISFSFSPQMLLLTRILYSYSLSNRLRVSKNLMLIVPEEEIDEEIERYKTLEIEIEPDLRAYQILKKARRYKINEQVGAFISKRDETEKAAYVNDWLYYASFSPIWKKRIENNNGCIVEEEKKVVFEDEEEEEEFYKNYGYEPDEQTNECQEKKVDVQTLKQWIQEEYKRSSNRLYQIDEEYLDEL